MQTANETIAVWGYVFQAGLGALLCWVARSVYELKLEVKAFRVTLFGETGENGLNSTIKEHSADLRRIRELLSGEVP